jgi:integrase
VRVTDKGAVSFVLRARFPGSVHFTRKALGIYPTLSLVDVREKARAWLRLIGEGRDPAKFAKAEAERSRLEEQKRQKHTFGYVAERYIDEAVIGPDPDAPLQRQGRRTAREIRNALIARFGNKPIVDIDDEDVVALLTEKRATPATAHNLFVHLRCVFAWAIEARRFGLKVSPTVHVKASKLIGDRNSRDRSLSDDELRAFWRAAEALPYPEGPAYKLLALTGLRLNEVVQASWPEFDLAKWEWLIPAARMKGKKSKARPHLVPLTDDMLGIINGLPRFDGGEFLFSRSRGKAPVNFGAKIKRKLDDAMLAELGKLSAWVNHDIRRSVKTNMSALRIPPVVSEAVLAHVQPGIAARYDVHDYRAEKLEALTAWGARLRQIVDPESTPSNVLRLPRAAS